MLASFEMSDLKTVLLFGTILVSILVIWAIVSSFVSVINTLIIEQDKQKYNELMLSFKDRFVDILSNKNYTEVKRSYLMSILGQELEQINRKTVKKYVGSVIKDTAKLHNIETFTGNIPNNVYLKLTTSDNSFIWCAFSDPKNRYIDFDKGEKVEVEGVIDQVNLVDLTLPNSLDDNVDKFFSADFAIHLQEDAKIKKNSI